MQLLPSGWQQTQGGDQKRLTLWRKARFFDERRGGFIPEMQLRAN